jgi:glycosyltransferase involved in cell wall biosynthesis
MRKRIVFPYIFRFKEYPIIFEYCTALQKRGFEVYYIGIADEEEDFMSEEGVHVTHFRRSAVSSALKYASHFRDRVKNISPQLVHVFHFRWSFLLPVITFFAYRFLLDVRTVHVVNKKGRHSITTPLKNLLTWFESWFYRYAIALTPSIKRMLSPSYKNIPVIPLGANLQKFNAPGKPDIRRQVRQDEGFKDTHIVFFYSGTLNPVRKIDITIQAFAELCKAIDNVYFVLAGDDKDNPHIIGKLADLARSLGVKDKVYFKGFVQYEPLIKYHQAFDIGLCFVPQTTYYDDQPPTKLFEYMAAGLVVIATGTSANRQVITDQVNGFICNDDVESLWKCMLEIVMKFQGVKDHVTAEALKTVAGYSWDHIIEQYVLKYYNTFMTDKK